jgi:hypothetical protein
MTWRPRTEPTPDEAERIAYANGDPNAPLLAQLADAEDVPTVEALEDEIAYLRRVLMLIEAETDIDEARAKAREALSAPD